MTGYQHVANIVSFSVFRHHSHMFTLIQMLSTLNTRDYLNFIAHDCLLAAKRCSKPAVSTMNMPALNILFYNRKIGQHSKYVNGNWPKKIAELYAKNDIQEAKT